jgi:hypothetical protein
MYRVGGSLVVALWAQTVPARTRVVSRKRAGCFMMVSPEGMDEPFVFVKAYGQEVFRTKIFR